MGGSREYDGILEPGACGLSLANPSHFWHMAIVSSHFDHLEAEYQRMRQKADSEDRKGMAWALVIVIAFYAAVGLGIKFML